MKHSITGSLFLGFFAVLLTCSTAYAATTVATVVAIRGNVQALNAQGKSRALAIQSAIFEDETLQTGERSRVQIMFSDNTLINLGNATTMKIAEYRYQPEQKDGALKTQIKEGTFRIMGGALAKTAPQNFKTETPTATIGIRGSMYAGLVTPDFLSVVFQGGKGIDITNAFGTVEITKPGYGTKVALNKPPVPPIKFTTKELGELNKALGGNGAEENGEDKENGSAPKEEPGSTTGPTDDDKASLGGGETVTTPFPTVLPIIPPVPDDIKKDVVVKKSQTDLVTTASITADSTVPNSTALIGKYRIILRDIDLALSNPSNFNSTFLLWDSGTVNATIFSNGTLQASSVTDGTSSAPLSGFPTSFGPYTFTNYTPAATSYSGFTSFTDTFSYNEPDAGLLTLTVTNYVEPSGQFFYNTTLFAIDLAPPDYDLLLASLVYAGIPSGGIPTTGIDKFTGHLIYDSPTSLDGNLEETRTVVNYYNKRFIGRSSDKMFQDFGRGGAVFFGSLAADGTAAVTILAGGDPYGNDVTAAFSNTATATLYGSFQQGLAFTASGHDYSIINNTETSSWDATGAAMRSPTRDYISYPTSPIAYTGFLIGVGDDTFDGSIHRIIMNTTSTDFAMSVNPTTGVLSGAINNLNDLIAIENEQSPVIMPTLTIGGSAAYSAYVANDNMVAILSGDSLKDYGNFLVTAGPDAPVITNVSNDFMTWGYWEIAYDDPSESNDHLFSSQSFFVAGQQTLITEVNSLITSSSSGTYTGKAFGIQIDSNGHNTQLTSSSGANLWGTVNLGINFAAAATTSVNGVINFDQAVLSINSGTPVLPSGFSAEVSTVSGAVPLSSSVNGAFFGSDAAAIGGNFQARMNDGVRYLGIFGGNR
ncbi:MAG: FecR domain-containing protein [Proteobacteria bacterium]|nr:FecR domain-containing protein [Pseudomonadota bacterium]